MNPGKLNHLNAIADILDHASGLTIEEDRQRSDNYCEVVILVAELDKWHQLLTNFLGEPIKPVGAKPNDIHKELTGEFGGININQILYSKKTSGGTYIAMLWPWQDHTLVTLKLISSKS